MSGNLANSLGGGIYNDSSSPRLVNCTLTANRAGAGAAIINYSGSQPVLTNTILWDNQESANTAINNDEGTGVTANYCLIGSGENDFTGTGNRVATASPFVSGTNLQLNPCSMVINTGDPASTTATSGATYLAGNPRFYQNGRIDMGAYEYQGTPSLPLAVTQQPASGSSVCAGNRVTATISVSGTSPAYQWYKFNLNNPVPGQTAATLSLTNLQTDQAGSYSVVVTGTCNSLTSTGFSLTVNAPPTATITASATAITCSSPTVSLSASGGDSYRWSTAQSSAVISVSVADTYSVTVTNASGCSATASQLITNGKTLPPAPNLSSLTVTQGAPTVSLTPSNCSGILSWNGPNGSSGTGTIQQVTTSVGQFAYSATCGVVA